MASAAALASGAGFGGDGAKFCSPRMSASALTTRCGATGALLSLRTGAKTTRGSVLSGASLPGGFELRAIAGGAEGAAAGAAETIVGSGTDGVISALFVGSPTTAGAAAT